MEKSALKSSNQGARDGLWLVFAANKNKDDAEVSLTSFNIFFKIMHLYQDRTVQFFPLSEF